MQAAESSSIEAGTSYCAPVLVTVVETALRQALPYATKLGLWRECNLKFIRFACCSRYLSCKVESGIDLSWRWRHLYSLLDRCQQGKGKQCFNWTLNQRHPRIHFVDTSQTKLWELLEVLVWILRTSSSAATIWSLICGVHKEKYSTLNVEALKCLSSACRSRRNEMSSSRPWQ